MGVVEAWNMGLVEAQNQTVPETEIMACPLAYSCTVNKYTCLDFKSLSFTLVGFNLFDYWGQGWRRQVSCDDLSDQSATDLMQYFVGVLAFSFVNGW